MKSDEHRSKAGRGAWYRWTLTALAGGSIACILWGVTLERHKPAAVGSPPTTGALRSPGSEDFPAGPHASVDEDAAEPLPSFEIIQAKPATTRRDIFRYSIRVIAGGPEPTHRITISSVSPPAAIAGLGRSIRLAVTGRDFPEDAQVVFDGSPMITRRENETLLTLELGSDLLSTARAAAVEVRSSGRPRELFSNALPFLVQSPPSPPFRFVGLIGDLGVFEDTESQSASFRARSGDVAGTWRIESIERTAAEVIDLRYGTRRRLPLRGE